MADIKPFRGLRYNEDKAGKLTELVAPPYDIISPKMQEDLYEKNENNVIRLEYGKIFEDDNENNNRYVRAKEALDKFLNNNIIFKDDEPAIYIYEQVFKLKDGSVKSFKGIYTLVKIEEFSKEIIMPHEETLSKAKSDRFNLMNATNCNFSAIYSLYIDDKKNIYPLIDENSKKTPDISFETDDNIIQNMWIIKDKAVIENLISCFSDRKIYIADGHHRYETALNYRNAKREANPDYSEDALLNYVMMFLVDIDNDGLLVFPTHRMIKDIKNFNENELLNKLSSDFDVEKVEGIDNIEESIYSFTEKKFGFYTGKDYYYILTLKNKNLMNEILSDKSDAYRNLDVSVLHSGILERYLGIDKEKLASQTNLTYTRSFDEAIAKVKDGEFQMSFVLNSTKIKEITDVSLNKERMPQKSTYFWPKIVTGIVMNELD